MCNAMDQADLEEKHATRFKRRFGVGEKQVSNAGKNPSGFWG